MPFAFCLYAAGFFRGVPGIHQPPPPPPPDELLLLEPLLLLLLLLESPPEPLERGADTPAAMPLAALAQDAPPPAPPDRPPPKPDQGGSDDELDPGSVLMLRFEPVVVLRRPVDQSSTCLPNPRASTHGYQSSRSSARSLRSSARKNSLAAASFLRTAIPALFCRDFNALIEK